VAKLAQVFTAWRLKRTRCIARCVSRAKWLPCLAGVRAINTGVFVWCWVVYHAPINFPPPAAMPETPKQIRLTISITPEVHAAFERLSAASGMSMSRCMGDWMADTLDAVEYTATMVEKARQAPKVVMRELHAYALGLADETGAVLNAIRSGQSITDIPSTAQKVKADRAAAASDEPKGGGGRRRAGSPPPCNTGGKLPAKSRQARGGKSS